ncbi:uncharacterized protein LOC108815338 [Raphanus sativus]|uniref:Uncharacterized protein LOC108815338 n=1 Tax=Raphanus sativus TaxID=3726 RepID=A0A6J0K926_RAPSA|nr:uncharacterized protein LOC108815338 [Raphanus sativus]
MDHALMALSLDEEETPFVMPDLPGFSSAEENKLSLMGRILNPRCQKMSSLIMKMPRKWQKEGRVRGIALSPERFQFIFKYEHDLVDVLERGVQTHQEWVIVLERWVENPPEDYLQFIPVWVQISKIPVNCYTVGALTALGDLVGKTVVVAFDPTKPVTQNFIRVKVNFNVAHPLKSSRTISLKGGTEAVVHFHYEKIQKRCFNCQRLNHEKDYCPLVVRQRQEDARLRREKMAANLVKKPLVLPEDDILFGVLEEEQVGMDPATGRWKIAKEVLEEMRRYLLADTGESKMVKVGKVQESVRSAEKDPMLQRSVLRLEPPPIITTDLNKGKGLVFDYSEKMGESKANSVKSNPTKLMADSFKALSADSFISSPVLKIATEEEDSSVDISSRKPSYPTVFKASNFAPCSSGVGKKRSAVRKRPPRAVRLQKRRELELAEINSNDGVGEGKQTVGNKKRKCSVEEVATPTTIKAVCLKVVPYEGSPKQL